MNPRPVRRGALTAVAASLLLAGPAAAHPFFEPDEAPVDSRAELTLDLAHGCGVDDHDQGDDAAADEEPTREVAIEVPDEVSWVEPADRDGWELEFETDDDGTVEVIVYTAEEGTDEPAPRFDLEAVLHGEVGDGVHWRVMQACDAATYRWVGTEDEPAEDPAVTVVLAEADPAAPPPEPDEAEEDPLDADADPDEPADDESADDELEVVTDEDVADDPDTDDLVDEVAEDTGMTGWLLIVILVAALGVAGLVLLLRDRGTGSDEDGQGAAG